MISFYLMKSKDCSSRLKQFSGPGPRWWNGAAAGAHGRVLCAQWPAAGGGYGAWAVDGMKLNQVAMG